MNVIPGETRFFVTMRVTKQNENFECYSFNPMAFHAGKSKVDHIEVNPMVCENIRTIGSTNDPNRMLVSGFFSSENGLFWKCFPASPSSYFGLLPLMVFPMPLLNGVTYLGGHDMIAVELVFLLGYLDHQYDFFRKNLKKDLKAAEEINALATAIENAAFKRMTDLQHNTFKKQLEESRMKHMFEEVVTEFDHDSKVQLDLW